MKKSKYLAASILLLVVAIGIKFGFRITYDPQLENSWDAISACAGWFAGIMSAIAVLVAINIPKKIAEQENKIVLYEKRYSTYNTTNYLMFVVEQITENCNVEDVFDYEQVVEILKKLIVVFENFSDVSYSEDKDVQMFIHKMIFDSKKLKYIFDLEENEIKILNSYCIALNNYISLLYKLYAFKSNNKEIELTYLSINASDYQKLGKELIKNYNAIIQESVLMKMEKQLNLIDKQI